MKKNFLKSKKVAVICVALALIMLVTAMPISVLSAQDVFEICEAVQVQDVFEICEAVHEANISGIDIQPFAAATPIGNVGTLFVNLRATSIHIETVAFNRGTNPTDFVRVEITPASAVNENPNPFIRTGEQWTHAANSGPGAGVVVVIGRIRRGGVTAPDGRVVAER